MWQARGLFCKPRCVIASSGSQLHEFCSKEEHQRCRHRQISYRVRFSSYYPCRPQPPNVAIFSQVEIHTTPDSTVHASAKKRIYVLPLPVTKWGTHPNCELAYHRGTIHADFLQKAQNHVYEGQTASGCDPHPPGGLVGWTRAFCKPPRKKMG